MTARTPTPPPGTPSGPPPGTAPGTAEPTPPQRFRVLVTGSRTWDRDADVTAALNRLHDEHGPALVLVHGACPRGADSIADTWGTRHGVTVERHPADWARDPKAAGRTRNAAMVAAGADLCLAFIRDNSPGATHCANLAEQAAIPTHRHTAPPAPRAARGAVGTVRRDALIPAALAYAARGWHVFPLRPDDKRPAFPDHPEDRCADRHGQRRDPRCARAGRHVGWQERATCDQGRICRAWSAAPYGIGIACGPSGLVVLDLDTPKPDPTGRIPEPPEPYRLAGVRDGADVFTTLCEHAGQQLPWDTYAVNTARGGTHLYYAAPPPEGPGEPLRNTTGTLGWLIDTRAAGGYVVAPPSTVAGRPYTLATDADTALAALPAWLAQRLTPAPLPPQKPVSVALSTGAGAGAGGDRAGAYLAAAVRAQTERVATAPDGQRNRALYRSALALGQLVAGGALEPDHVTTTLTHAARTAGLGATETAKTIASGLTAGARRPRHLPGGPGRASGVAA